MGDDLHVIRSVRLSRDLSDQLGEKATERDVSVSDLLRAGVAWVLQASDGELDRMAPPELGHAFTLTADEQRKRGWYLAWRCVRRNCDARGSMTVPTREKALELLTVVADGHRNLTESEGT